jgi:hypothetical protein
MGRLLSRVLPYLAAAALAVFAFAFILGPDGPLSRIRETGQRGSRREDRPHKGMGSAHDDASRRRGRRGRHARRGLEAAGSRRMS